jgi:hypothetical protein
VGLGIFDNIPTSFVSEAISKGPHVIANCCPFSSTYDSNVLDGQNSKEEVLIGPIVPVLVHFRTVLMEGGAIAQ